ncbi:MAG: ABC transporter substrate-binding protein [Bacteroidota bacterium]|nr:ABC transporter substrate-binding protein [Bacteroidota bacterium]
MKNLFLLLFTLIAFLPAQQDEVYFSQGAEDYFLLGMKQYAQKDYKLSSISFQNSIHIFPANHRITAASIMLAKTLYAMKNYAEAEAVCDSLITQFPNSAYIEDALFTRGMCRYNSKLYLSTFEEMQKVFSISQQRLNKEHSLKVIDHVATEFLTEADLQAVISSPLNDTIRSLITVILAEKYFHNGSGDKAKALIQNFHDETDGKTLQLRVNRLLARIERGNGVKIGLLLPLFDSTSTETREKKIAHEILEGAQLAISTNEERTEPGRIAIELDVKDSRRSHSLIDSIITMWEGDSKIVGIVGPIFSDETMQAAVAAQQKKIPLVSPTATDEGIAQIGEYVFQANPNNSMRAKIMAQYAVNFLGAKNVAILASDIPSVKMQADTFAAEIVRLGSNIVVDRRYQQNELDLRRHLKVMRDTASRLAPEYIVTFKGKINIAEVTGKLASFGVRVKLIDSLIAHDGSLNLSKLFNNRAKEISDSLKLPVKIVTMSIDSLQYPVSSIDVIFCPIAKSQLIGVITSQVTYFNLKTTILGTSEWYNLHELEMNRRYADGVVFGSDRWTGQGERWTRLSSRYAQKFGKQITDNVFFGYDVMSLVIQQVNDGALTRDQLAKALSFIVNFQGVRNNITLSTGRVNGNLHILQYKDGTVSKLQTYTYQ